jgi:hypothetical protein
MLKPLGIPEKLVRAQAKTDQALEQEHKQSLQETQSQIQMQHCFLLY